MTQYHKPNRVLCEGPEMKTQFTKGQRVRYVPNHAKGDPNHPDCETGVVRSVRDDIVFVLYDNKMCIMVIGNEPYTSQATHMENLIREQND